MRLRNVTGSREVIAGSRFVVPEEEQKSCPGRWRERFGNQNTLYIEIGMGKGKFIHTMAKEHPEINFVGIEKYSTVLLRAVQIIWVTQNGDGDGVMLIQPHITENMRTPQLIMILKIQIRLKSTLMKRYLEILPQVSHRQWRHR